MATESSSTPTSLLVAIIAMVTISLIAVVVVIVTVPGDELGHAVGFIMAIVIPTIAGLLAFLKANTAVKKVEEVHLSVNSRMTMLLEAVQLASHQEGVIQGETGVVTPQQQTTQEILTKPGSQVPSI